MLRHAIALVLLTLPGAALAVEPRDRATSTQVSYADLDLSRAEDRETLDRRLGEAAARVCRNELVGSVWTSLQLRGCVAATLAEGRRSAERIIAAAEQPSDAARSSIAVR